MSSNRTSGLHERLDRTRAQIADLARLIEGFLMYWPIGMVSKYEVDGDQEVWSFAIGAPVPSEVPIRAGEILHNLRAPLDHIACIVADAHTGSRKGVYFPFGEDEAAFEKQVEQKCKKLPAEAIELIRKFKPYRGGNNLLWAVHALNRADKHRVEIVPVNLGSTCTTESELIIWSGMVLVSGPRHGQHLVSDRLPDDVIEALGSPVEIYRLPRGTQLHYSTNGCTPEQSMEFLVTTPGATFTTDLRPTLNVAFRENPESPLEPICEVLTRMRGEVEKTVQVMAGELL